MTPEQALQVLSLATEPGIKITRIDYCRIQQALEILDALVKDKTNKTEAVNEL